MKSLPFLKIILSVLFCYDPNEIFLMAMYCTHIANYLVTVIGFRLPMIWYSVLYIFGAVKTDFEPTMGKKIQETIREEGFT